MKVLVTRDREESGDVERRLARLGIVCVHAPVLRIEAVEPVDPPPVDCRAILVTSANAIRHLPPALRDRNLPVLAVGKATAEAALGSGFAHVEGALGNVESLVELACARLPPGEGTLLYLRGRDIRRDLARMLAGRGYRVADRVVYRAEPVEALPEHVERQIRNGEIGAALVLSRRAAANFASLLAGLPRDCVSGVRVLALAPPVAEPLADSGFRSVECAARPDLDALLAMLGAPPA